MERPYNKGVVPLASEGHLFCAVPEVISGMVALARLAFNLMPMLIQKIDDHIRLAYTNITPVRLSRQTDFDRQSTLWCVKSSNRSAM